MPPKSTTPGTRKLKALIFVAVVGGLAVAAIWLPIASWLLAALAWIEGHRTVAWIVYVLGYVAATVLLIPGSILTLGAGFVFGLAVGTAVVSAGSVLGAVAAFLVGRFFARDWVAGRISEMPRFRALDRATRTEGFVIVLLARLSPLFPFNLLNYAFGITSVRLRDYFLASWIGMLPATLLYVYIGSLAKSLTEIAAGGIEAGTAGRALFALGLAATLVLTVVLTRKATRALSAHLGAE